MILRVPSFIQNFYKVKTLMIVQFSMYFLVNKQTMKQSFVSAR